MDWKKYEASVRDEIGVPAGDADRVQRAITSAISYVDSAIDGHTVDDTVRADCTIPHQHRPSQIGLAETERGRRAHGRAGDRMTVSVREEREALMDLLTDAAGDLVAAVTIDAQEARPLPGKAVMLIDPPTITFEGYQFQERIWTVNVIAGTTATQVQALDIITPVVERLWARKVNMRSAKPVTYSLAGVGNLAAYELTLNPLELTED